MAVDEVMSATEIASQVTVSQRTVTTQCKKWKEQGLARKLGRDWIVDKRTALAYIAKYEK